MTKFVMFFCEE